MLLRHKFFRIISSRRDDAAGIGKHGGRRLKMPFLSEKISELETESSDIYWVGHRVVDLAFVDNVVKYSTGWLADTKAAQPPGTSILLSTCCQQKIVFCDVMAHPLFLIFVPSFSLPKTLTCPQTIQTYLNFAAHEEKEVTSLNPARPGSSADFHFPPDIGFHFRRTKSECNSLSSVVCPSTVSNEGGLSGLREER